MLPSVSYYVDVYLQYYSELFFETRHPKGSDPLDFEQLLYLDRMDYFVTNETALRRSADSCGNNEVRGRLLSLDEFKAACNKSVFFLRKRAPLEITGKVAF